jgi:predicted O-methyltransferase YrrM
MIPRRLRRRLGDAYDKRALARVLSREYLSWQIRRDAPPRLLELHQSASTVHDRARTLVKELFPDVAEDALEAYVHEHAAAVATIAARAAALARQYPEYFTVEHQTSELLYVATRIARPSVAFETGVADGRSTAVILAAMEANGTGTLHSVDISSNVGALVGDRSRWQLHVLDPSTSQFEQLVASMPSIELFLHDADHSYANQTREYEAVWPKVVAGGVFISDDIDFSWAAKNFFESKQVDWHLLMENRKAVGVVRR